jgi:5-methylcytosine-specific restriction endonuclease McrA
MNECTHPNQEHAIWTLSNKAQQIVMQCKDCGESTSSAISRSKFTPEEIAAMPPRNIELRDRLRKEAEDARIRESGLLAERVDFNKEADRIERTTEYHAYLRSPEWWQRRTAVMRRENNTCQGCGCRAMEVHHTTYKHLFNEFLFELMAVCRSCHARIHGREE